MYCFHFNGGPGRDYVVIAETFNQAQEGLRKMGISTPEKLDCMSSAPINVNEVITIRATNQQSFAMHTTGAKKEK